MGRSESAVLSLRDDLWVQKALTCQKVKDGLFEAEPYDHGFPHLYGGQTAALALIAAMDWPTFQEKENGSPQLALGRCHVLKATFLNPGTLNERIFLNVKNVRLGARFTSKLVEVYQDQVIVALVNIGFHKEEQGPTHHPKARHTTSPLKYVKKFDKTCDFRDPGDPEHKSLWFKGQECKGLVPSEAFLAYASDFGLASAGLYHHKPDQRLFVTSLDHAVWFHQPSEPDAWHLHVMESPFMGHGRGYNLGKIYLENGELVASTAQESLLRLMKSEH